jgi:hypothetical protein
VRGTAGRDIINYPHEVSAKTADMEMVKVLLQGAVSDRKRDSQSGRFFTMDIKDFYLAAPMDLRVAWLALYLVASLVVESADLMVEMMVMKSAAY